jgi:hypothetical protein
VHQAAIDTCRRAGHNRIRVSSRGCGGDGAVGWPGGHLDSRRSPCPMSSPVTPVRGNELRVCAARSRRRNSVGRTRGVGRLALWRFHQGRSERGLIIAAQPAWSAWYDRNIAAGSGGFKTIGNVIWSKVGPPAALATGDLRGVPRHAAARPDDGGGGIRTDHGAMACCGVYGPSVRMKTSRP